MKANDETLHDLFIKSALKDSRLCIPSYQRPYTWDEENVEKLLDSFCNTFGKMGQKDYLIGNIVLKPKRKNEVLDFDVIDGQQRLTTILLICEFMYSLRDKIDRNVYEDTAEQLVDIRNILQLKKDKVKRIYYDDKSVQNNFKEFYNFLEEDNTDAKTNKRNNYIINYKAIVKYFNDNYENLKTEQSIVDLINNFLNSLDKIKVVLTLVGENEDELEIFDVMNSTGVALSIENILKSKFLKKIDDQDEEEFSELWNAVFRDGKESNFWTRNNSANAKDFFYSYFKIHFISSGGSQNEVSKTEKYFKEVYEKYLNSLDQNSIKNEFNKVLKYASIYKNLSELDFKELLEDNFIQEAPYNLQHLIFVFKQWGVWVLLPVVLYSVAENIEVDELCSRLLNITMYWLLNNKSSQGLNKQVLQLLYLVYSNNIADIYNIAFFKYNPSTIKADISDCFNVSLQHISHNKLKTIYMMLWVKKSLKNKDYQITDMNLKDLDKKKISLEHIYPQSKKNNPPLQNDDKIYFFGNLLLLLQKTNSKIKDKAFINKKADYKNFAKDVSYCDEIISKEQWTDKEIEEMNEVYKNDFIKYFTPSNLSNT